MKVNRQPSTLNLQPSTLNLQPSTFNPQPSTLPQPTLRERQGRTALNQISQL
ncbi:hypothetical protein [Moorena bouillonii]|uniref:hypothetical protein n=1 Tax=Moorena bouillonii TaxID=207920 RepID=UPI001301760A|nr:hypothetical protein [Moorena bouillonii]